MKNFIFEFVELIIKMVKHFLTALGLLGSIALALGLIIGGLTLVISPVAYMSEYFEKINFTGFFPVLIYISIFTIEGFIFYIVKTKFNLKL